jgi:prepilin-type processing-associated H-X9-DG protein
MKLNQFLVAFRHRDNKMVNLLFVDANVMFLVKIVEI